MRRIGFAVFVAVICSMQLAWVYAWCMVDPSLPDYEMRKVRMMFRMSDQGMVTVPALLGLVGSLVVLLCSLAPRAFGLTSRKE
jgi:hypothetical protein